MARMTIFQYFSNEVDKAQDQVTHYDSVSNTSRKSKASKASSVSSACQKAEAEKAALQAQDAAPKNKEALKLQEQTLKVSTGSKTQNGNGKSGAGNRHCSIRCQNKTSAEC